MLDIFLLGTCRWSELLMYFGSFALWALKNLNFLSAAWSQINICQLLITVKNWNKNVIEKSKTNQYTLGKQKETKLKRKTKTKNKRRKKKQKEIICHQIASSLNDLSLDWLIQKNDDVMILIYDQQEEYYANLPIINGIRKH